MPKRVERDRDRTLHLQARLTLRMDIRHFEHLISLKDSKPELVARLRSCSGQGSWLRNSVDMPGDAWRIAMRMRLGLPPADFEDAMQCPGCQGQITSKELVTHALSCNKVAGVTKVHRHNRVMNSIVRTLNAHSIGTFPVPVGYNDKHKGQRTAERPDFVIVSHNDLICTDVTIGMPTAKAYKKHAAKTDQWTANYLERLKCLKHGGAAESHRHKFIPFAMEAFGRLGEKTTNLIRMLGERHGPAVAWELREAIAIEQQRANVDMLVMFMTTRPRGSETSHTACGPRPKSWQYRTALNHQAELQSSIER